MEYQILLNRSGIPEKTLDVYCRSFLTQYGRFPHLDELPSNSRQNLVETLKIDSDGFTSKEVVLEFTKSDEESVNAVINDQYRDLQVGVTFILDTAIVGIKQRPTFYNEQDSAPIIPDINLSPRSVIINIADKLDTYYGVKFIPVTTAELSELGVEDLAKSFILNNNIYVNTDLATLDSPIHEILHLLLGSIKFQNPKLYTDLVQTAAKFGNYNKIAKLYPNRIQSDILEELFVEEFGKYLVGNSQLNDLPANIQYEISYNVTRLLDSILMGDTSVRSLDKNIYNMSLQDLVKSVNSRLMTSALNINLQDAALHRELGNLKEDLMRKGDLREECN